MISCSPWALRPRPTKRLPYAPRVSHGTDESDEPDRSAAIGRAVLGGSASLRMEKADSAPLMMRPGIAWLTRAKIRTITMIQADMERTGIGRRCGRWRRSQSSRRRKPRPTMTSSIHRPNPTGKTIKYWAGV